MSSDLCVCVVAVCFLVLAMHSARRAVSLEQGGRGHNAASDAKSAESPAASPLTAAASAATPAMHSSGAPCGSWTRRPSVAALNSSLAASHGRGVLSRTASTSLGSGVRSVGISVGGIGGGGGPWSSESKQLEDKVGSLQQALATLRSSASAASSAMHSGSPGGSGPSSTRSSDGHQGMFARKTSSASSGGSAAAAIAAAAAASSSSSSPPAASAPPRPGTTSSGLVLSTVVTSSLPHPPMPKGARARDAGADASQAFAAYSSVAATLNQDQQYSHSLFPHQFGVPSSEGPVESAQLHLYSPPQPPRRAIEQPAVPGLHLSSSSSVSESRPHRRRVPRTENQLASPTPSAHSNSASPISPANSPGHGAPPPLHTPRRPRGAHASAASNDGLALVSPPPASSSAPPGPMSPADLIARYGGGGLGGSSPAPASGNIGHGSADSAVKSLRVAVSSSPRSGNPSVFATNTPAAAATPASAALTTPRQLVTPRIQQALAVPGGAGGGSSPASNSPSPRNSLRSPGSSSALLSPTGSSPSPSLATTALQLSSSPSSASPGSASVFHATAPSSFVESQFDPPLFYTQRCAAHGIAPNSVLLQMFQQGLAPRRVWDCGYLYLGHRGVQPLLDTLAAGGDHVEELSLRGTGMRNEQLSKLIEIVRQGIVRAAEQPVGSPTGAAAASPTGGEHSGPRALRTLDLADNPLSDSAGAQLLLLVNLSPSLTRVHLDGTRIDEVSVRAITSACLSKLAARPSVSKLTASTRRYASFAAHGGSGGKSSGNDDAASRMLDQWKNKLLEGFARKDVLADIAAGEAEEAKNNLEAAARERDRQTVRLLLRCLQTDNDVVGLLLRFDETRHPEVWRDVRIIRRFVKRLIETGHHRKAFELADRFVHPQPAKNAAPPPVVVSGTGVTPNDAAVAAKEAAVAAAVAATTPVAPVVAQYPPVDFRNDEILQWWRVYALARSRNFTDAFKEINLLLESPALSLAPTIQANLLGLAGMLRKCMYESGARADLASIESSLQEEDANESANLYLKSYETAQGLMEGVAAATMMRLANKDEESAKLAKKMLKAATAELALLERGIRGKTSGVDDTERKLNLYSVLAEANINLERPNAAYKFYQAAVSMAGSNVNHLAQLQQNLQLLSQKRVRIGEVMQLFHAGNVCVFTGLAVDHPLHDIYAFPPERDLELELSYQIELALDLHQIQIGFVSLSCGSEILFAEKMLERKCELHVVLPFALDDFFSSSIDYGLASMYRWHGRAQSILKRCETHYTTSERFLGDGGLFAFQDVIMEGLALIRSRELGVGAPIALAILDSHAVFAQCRPNRFIRQWRAKKATVGVIDLQDVRRRVLSLPSAGSTQIGSKEPGGGHGGTNFPSNAPRGTVAHRFSEANPNASEAKGDKSGGAVMAEHAPSTDGDSMMFTAKPPSSDSTTTTMVRRTRASPMHGPDSIGGAATMQHTLSSTGKVLTAMQFASRITRVVKYMMFADIESTQTMSESLTPIFFKTFFKLLEKARKESRVSPFYANTWGSGLYFIFHTVDQCAEFSLHLLQVVAKMDWASLGLPPATACLGMHGGPLFPGYNPVEEKDFFFGAHVCRAARIKAVTPAGHAYASEQFVAALAVADGDRKRFFFEYLGHRDLAKCWAKGTKLRMFDGSCKAVEEIREGDVMMGDDSTPRVVLQGSLIRGDTREDQREMESQAGFVHNAPPTKSTPGMYRIDPAAHSGRESFTVNNRHILVLIFLCEPTMVVRSVSQSALVTRSIWSFSQLVVGEGNVVSDRTFSFATEPEALHHRARVLWSWKPLEWEGTVDEFLCCSAAVQELARMWQPETGVVFAPPVRCLAERIAEVIRREPTTLELRRIAWALGVWMADESKIVLGDRSVHSACPVVRELDAWSADLTGLSTISGIDAAHHVLHALATSYDWLSRSHVPLDLVRESREVRLSLLGGILDGGGLDAYQFASKDRSAIDGVVELSRSLGFVTSEVSCVKEGTACAGFKFSIDGDLSSIPTVRVSKRSVIAEGSRRDLHYAGFTITRVRHGRYFGFTLTGDGRCLLSDFVVTHNSYDRCPLYRLCRMSDVRKHAVIRGSLTSPSTAEVESPVKSGPSASDMLSPHDTPATQAKRIRERRLKDRKDKDKGAAASAAPMSPSSITPFSPSDLSLLHSGPLSSLTIERATPLFVSRLVEHYLSLDPTSDGLMYWEDVTLLHALVSRLIALGQTHVAFLVVQKALAYDSAYKNDLRLKYYRVLALRHTQKAEEFMKELKEVLASHPRPNQIPLELRAAVLSLSGRMLKDKYYESVRNHEPNPSIAHESAREYFFSYELVKSSFPAINAATMLLLSKQKERARALAKFSVRLVADELLARSKQHWNLSSQSTTLASQALESASRFGGAFTQNAAAGANAGAGATGQEAKADPQTQSLVSSLSSAASSVRVYGDGTEIDERLSAEEREKAARGEAPGKGSEKAAGEGKAGREIGEEYWLYAAMGEAYLVLDEADKCTSWYRHALEKAQGHMGSISTMYRNFLLLQSAIKVPQELHELFLASLGRVLVCAAHPLIPWTGPYRKPKVEPAVVPTPAAAAGASGAQRIEEGEEESEEPLSRARSIKRLNVQIPSPRVGANGQLSAPPPLSSLTPQQRYFRLLEERVVAEIRLHISTARPTVAFVFLLTDTDLLFAECLMERGVEVHVLLVYTKSIFLQRCVEHGFERLHNWQQRVDMVFKRTILHFVTRDKQATQKQLLYHFNRRVLQGLTILRAQQLDCGNPLALCVLDGLDAQGNPIPEAEPPADASGSQRSSFPPLDRSSAGLDFPNQWCAFDAEHTCTIVNLAAIRLIAHSENEAWDKRRANEVKQTREVLLQGLVPVRPSPPPPRSLTHTRRPSSQASEPTSASSAGSVPSSAPSSVPVSTGVSPAAATRTIAAAVVSPASGTALPAAATKPIVDPLFPILGPVKSLVRSSSAESFVKLPSVHRRGSMLPSTATDGTEISAPDLPKRLELPLLVVSSGAPTEEQKTQIVELSSAQAASSVSLAPVAPSLSLPATRSGSSTLSRRHLHHALSTLPMIPQSPMPRMPSASGTVPDGRRVSQIDFPTLSRLGSIENKQPQASVVDDAASSIDVRISSIVSPSPVAGSALVDDSHAASLDLSMLSGSPSSALTSGTSGGTSSADATAAGSPDVVTRFDFQHGGRVTSGFGGGTSNDTTAHVTPVSSDLEDLLSFPSASPHSHPPHPQQPQADPISGRSALVESTLSSNTTAPHTPRDGMATEVRACLSASASQPSIIAQQQRATETLKRMSMSHQSLAGTPELRSSPLASGASGSLEQWTTPRDDAPPNLILGPSASAGATTIPSSVSFSVGGATGNSPRTSQGGGISPRKSVTAVSPRTSMNSGSGSGSTTNAISPRSSQPESDMSSIQSPPSTSKPPVHSARGRAGTFRARGGDAGVAAPLDRIVSQEPGSVPASALSGKQPSGEELPMSESGVFRPTEIASSAHASNRTSPHQFLSITPLDSEPVSPNPAGSAAGGVSHTFPPSPVVALVATAPPMHRRHRSRQPSICDLADIMMAPKLAPPAAGASSLRVSDEVVLHQKVAGAVSSPFVESGLEGVFVDQDEDAEAMQQMQAEAEADAISKAVDATYSTPAPAPRTPVRMRRAGSVIATSGHHPDLERFASSTQRSRSRATGHGNNIHRASSLIPSSHSPARSTAHPSSPNVEPASTPGDSSPAPSIVKRSMSITAAAATAGSSEDYYRQRAEAVAANMAASVEMIAEKEEAAAAATAAAATPTAIAEVPTLNTEADSVPSLPSEVASSAAGSAAAAEGLKPSGVSRQGSRVRFQRQGHRKTSSTPLNLSQIRSILAVMQPADSPKEGESASPPKAAAAPAATGGGLTPEQPSSPAAASAGEKHEMYPSQSDSGSGAAAGSSKPSGSRGSSRPNSPHRTRVQTARSRRNPADRLSRQASRSHSPAPPSPKPGPVSMPFRGGGASHGSGQARMGLQGPSFIGPTLTEASYSRAVRFIIFADVRNYSKLSQEQTPLFCVVQGTPVTLAGGSASCPIESLRPGDLVRSCKITAAVASSKSGALRASLISRPVAAVFDRGVRECVEVTLSDGRKLVVTPDHRILTTEGWCQAQHLRPGHSTAIIGSDPPSYDPAEDRADERTAEWSFDCSESLQFVLDFATPVSRSRSLAFFGLLGYLITDGTLSADGRGGFYLRHELDVAALQADVQLLTGTTPACRMMGKTFSVALPRRLGSAFIAAGAQPFDRHDTLQHLPSALFTCPTALIRSFLSGLFGGVGHSFTLHDKRGRGELAGLGFSMSGRGSSAEAQMKSLRSQLTSLLELSGMQSRHLRWEARTGTNTTDATERQRRKSLGLPVAAAHLATLDAEASVNLRLRITHGGSLHFADRIGFAYSCHKQARLDAGTLVIRTQRTVQQQRKAIVKKYCQFARRGGTHGVLFAAAKDAVRRRCALHPSVEAWKPHRASHDLKTLDRSGLDVIPLLDEYCGGSTELFGERGQPVCGFKRGSGGLPVWRMRVLSVRPVGPRHTWDIQVDQSGDAKPSAMDDASFVAQGVVVHNCTHFLNIVRQVIDLFLEQPHIAAAAAPGAPPPPPSLQFWNTWGDGLFVVFADPVQCSRFALVLLQKVHQTRWAMYGLPSELTMRVGMHAGPVLVGWDPVVRHNNFFGPHVLYAQLIEPITTPGCAFATAQFAACLATSPEAVEFKLEYIGSSVLEKEFADADYAELSAKEKQDYARCHLYNLTENKSFSAARIPAAQGTPLLGSISAAAAAVAAGGTPALSRAGSYAGGVAATGASGGSFLLGDGISDGGAAAAASGGSHVAGVFSVRPALSRTNSRALRPSAAASGSVTPSSLVAGSPASASSAAASSGTGADSSSLSTTSPSLAASSLISPSVTYSLLKFEELKTERANQAQALEILQATKMQEAAAAAAALAMQQRDAVGAPATGRRSSSKRSSGGAGVPFASDLLSGSRVGSSLSMLLPAAASSSTAEMAAASVAAASAVLATPSAAPMQASLMRFLSGSRNDNTTERK